MCSTKSSSETLHNLPHFIIYIVYENPKLLWVFDFSCIYKIWQILKHFAGTFRRAQTLKLGGVFYFLTLCCVGNWGSNRSPFSFVRFSSSFSEDEESSSATFSSWSSFLTTTWRRPLMRFRIILGTASNNWLKYSSFAGGSTSASSSSSK